MLVRMRELMRADRAARLGPRNRPAVFVLSPPRSGSTLLRVMLGDKTLGTYSLHPVEDVGEAGFFSRMIDDVKLWMQ